MDIVVAAETIYVNFEGDVVAASSPDASHVLLHEGQILTDDEAIQYLAITEEEPPTLDTWLEDRAAADAAAQAAAQAAAILAATPSIPTTDAGMTADQKYKFAKYVQP